MKRQTLFLFIVALLATSSFGCEDRNEETTPQALIDDIWSAGSPPDYLESTDSGFRHWEWLNRSNIESFYLHDPFFVRWLPNSDVRSISVWESVGSDEPDLTLLRWHEVYGERGQLVERVVWVGRDSFVEAVGVYDDLGRIVSSATYLTDGETRSRENLQRLYTYAYFEPVDGDNQVVRLITNSNDEIVSVELERRLATGWEYSYSGSRHNVFTMSIEVEDGEVQAVSTRSVGGDRTQLILARDERGRIVRSEETYSWKESRVVYEYTFDEVGLLVYAHSRDEESGEDEIVRHFDDHDERGNWQLMIERSGDEILGSVFRKLGYE